MNNTMLYERDPRWREQKASIKSMQAMMKFTMRKLEQCEDRTRRINLTRVIQGYVMGIEHAEEKLARIEQTIDAEHNYMLMDSDIGCDDGASRIIENIILELYLNGELG